MSRPLLLLSNDDGFMAHGLRTLRSALQEWAEVVICAPATEQSATSHAISLSAPLRLVEHEEGVYAVDGTPADCVYVALCAKERVLSRTPDLVVSGINHGLNLAADVFYSGTVAAAREGALRGIPAVAFSASYQTELEEAAKKASVLTKRLLHQLRAESEDERGSAPTPLLNVNFPPGSSWELEATRLGLRQYEEKAEFRKDPRGGEYLWLGGSEITHGVDDGTDTAAYDQGKVSVSPLSLEMWEPQGQPLVERLAQEVNGAGELEA